MLFHQTRQISPSSKYSPHTLLQKMHLTPLFIPAFPSPLTNAFPHLSHHIPRQIKAYTQYKSSALFYEYTFSRFYVITEVSQIKFPHHHPAPLCKHCSENEPSFLPSTLQSPPPKKDSTSPGSTNQALP